MGFLNGRVSYMRFRVSGESALPIDEELLEKVSAHAIGRHGEADPSGRFEHPTRVRSGQDRGGSGFGHGPHRSAGSLAELLPSTVYAPTEFGRNSGKWLNQQWVRWERWLCRLKK